MVKLRLKRIGKKQAPFYRIVAADSRVNRNGKYIELIGTFNPLNEEVTINKELAIKWLQNGAQPTETVRVLFSKQGVMKDIHELKLSTKVKKPKTEKKVVKTKPVKETKVAEKKTTVRKTPVRKTATKKVSETKVDK